MDSPGNWPDLPNDLLERIFQRLIVHHPSHLFTCLAVCASWRSVGKQFFRHRLPTLPPFIISHDRKLINLHSNHYIKGKHGVPLPSEFRKSWCCGASHGWLISVQVEEPHDIRLFNPVSRAQIQLPNFRHQKGLLPTKLRIIMSANPSYDPNCLFLALHTNTTGLALCRLGDKEWTNLPNQSNVYSDCCAATFYKGRFYVYYDKGLVLQMEQLDLNLVSLHEKYVIRSLKTWEAPYHSSDDYFRFAKRYMVESSSGDLLIISKYAPVPGHVKFKVHKLDHQRNHIGLTEVEDLGNQALFIGFNNSVSVHIPNGSSTGGSACGSNCIYYLDDTATIRMWHRNRGLYDIKTREFKCITPYWPAGSDARSSWIRLEL